jgi:hypothetical protein
MGAHPANLVLRFLLELSAYFILGLWGWHRREDGFRILIAVAIPLVAAAIWGTFAVPNDPSRGAWAPVPIAGLLRLALELGFFGLAAVALYDLGFHNLTALFATVVAIHYLISYDRVRWLVGQ